MNLHTEVYTSKPVDAREKLDSLDHSIWSEIVEDATNGYVTQGRASEIEAAILEGIPAPQRAAVYLKTANVTTVIEKTSYSSIVKKARSTLSEETKGLLLGTGFPEELQEILLVFSYCNKESINEEKEDSAPNLFILHLCAALYRIPNLTEEETLFLLFKFDKLYSRLHRDEFYYKLSRTLEDADNEVFLHIVKQGININDLCKSLIHRLFSELAEDELLFTIADFILFEGLDYFLRLFGAIFRQEQSELQKLEGNELNEYLYSGAIIKTISKETLQISTEIEPKVVKYENEFHLMSANAISGNYDELSNLKEANDDLKFKIKDFNSKFQNLKLTQDEILQQSSDFNKRVEDALKKKEELTEQVKELQEKYANLTMRENLRNTIQANKDISRENQQLEDQIAELEKKIQAKEAKLEK